MAQADQAERVQEWKLAAERWLLNVPSGREFTADDLVAEIGLPDSGTNRNNVVGAKISSWSKARRIHWTGRFRKSARVVRHGNPQRVWISL